MTPPSAELGRPQRWFTLGEASRFLGIDDSTLRAWTDAGRIQAFRTPGGHRRFAYAELLAFLRRHRQGPTVDLAHLIERHGNRLLQGKPGQRIRGEHWYAALDARTSEAMRQTCQRLMRALAGYLEGGPRQSAHLLAGARAGRALGAHVAAVQIPPSEATRAFLFFKDLINNAVARRLPLSPDQKVRSLRQIDAFLNRALLQMMGAFERGRVRKSSSRQATRGRGHPDRG